MKKIDENFLKNDTTYQQLLKKINDKKKLVRDAENLKNQYVTKKRLEMLKNLDSQLFRQREIAGRIVLNFLVGRLKIKRDPPPEFSNYLTEILEQGCSADEHDLLCLFFASNDEKIYSKNK